MWADDWPPPWGQEPVSRTPPVLDDAAVVGGVVGGEWVTGQQLPRPPRLVQWANRARTPRWRDISTSRLVAGAGALAAVVLVAVTM